MMSFVQKTLVDSDCHEFVNHKTRENDVAFVSFDPIGLLSTNHIVILQGHTKVYKEMFNVNTKQLTLQLPPLCMLSVNCILGRCVAL